MDGGPPTTDATEVALVLLLLLLLVLLVVVVVLLVSSVVAVAPLPGAATVSTFEVLVSLEGDDFSPVVFSSSLAVTSSSVAASDDVATSAAPVDTVSRGLIPGKRDDTDSVS